MNGLSSKQVEASRAKYGDNKLPEKKLKTGLDFFLDIFKDKFNLILVGIMVIFSVLAVAGQGSWSELFSIISNLLAIAIISINTGSNNQERAKEIEDKTRDGVTKRIGKFCYTGVTIIIIALLISGILNISGISSYFGFGWMTILRNTFTIVTTVFIIVVTVMSGE